MLSDGAPTATHEVLNQAPPRVDLNEYATNVALTDAVATFGAHWATAELTTTGALVGQADFQRDVELAHTSPPRLHTHDRWGHRVDEIEFHPGYHRIIGPRLPPGRTRALGQSLVRAPIWLALRSSTCSRRSSPATPARSR